MLVGEALAVIKRWWDDLVARNRGLFVQWQWTGTFEWIR